MAQIETDRATARSSGLFYQIARRLAVVAIAFALLEIVIVVVTYARDEATLSEDVITMEAERVLHHVAAHGLGAAARPIFPGSPPRAVAIYDEHGTRLLVENDHGLALPPAPPSSVTSQTTREVDGARYLLKGIRRAELDGRTVWIALAVAGEGFRPLLPALYEEVAEHALLPLIPLSLLLLVFNVGIVRRMLSPLAQAVAEVDALSPADPGRRLRLPTSPAEVRSLLGAMNRALDRLEIAMRTLRQFTADAAHELRTPLAVMTLTIDRLPASAEKTKLREDAAAMGRLITQILDLARAESSDDAREAETDLDALARRVAAEMTPLAIGLGKRIRYRNDGSRVVRGSSELIERALRNLIENALAHAPDGDEIEVRVARPAAISVRDHGPGIPAEARERVFERFWRADRARAGTGLGLAITRSIMSGCGGDVEIADAPGGGAMVTLRFAEADGRERD